MWVIGSDFFKYLSMFALLTISPVNFCLLLLPLDGECIPAVLGRSEERGQVGAPVEVGGDPVLNFCPRLLVAIQVLFFLLICLGGGSDLSAFFIWSSDKFYTEDQRLLGRICSYFKLAKFRWIAEDFLHKWAKKLPETGEKKLTENYQTLPEAQRTQAIECDTWECICS